MEPTYLTSPLALSNSTQYTGLVWCHCQPFSSLSQVLKNRGTSKYKVLMTCWIEAGGPPATVVLWRVQILEITSSGKRSQVKGGVHSQSKFISQDEEHRKGADSRHGEGGDGGHVERACLLRQNRTARTIHGGKKTRSGEVVCERGKSTVHRVLRLEDEGRDARLPRGLLRQW